MPDINKPINMSEKDLIKRQEEIAPVNISESLVEMVRSSAPKADWKLTDEIVENICHNLNLLAEACEEFGGSMDVLKDGAEACDVTIRCYLLGGAISDVLDELEDELEEV